jgi:hypothetical protein
MRILRGEEDRAMRAVASAPRALWYTEGAEHVPERPAFVRAGSGMARVGRWLVVVQDDVNFIAILDERGERVRCEVLPAGQGGARIFEERRGNKGAKWDLEACVGVGQGWVLAVGSGARPARCRMALLRVDEASGELAEARVVELPALYAALAGCEAFAGGELNIEGAVWTGEALVLFNRGNGEGAQRDATVALEWAALWAHLMDAANVPPPALGAVQAYELGELDGVRLTFTDAAVREDGAVVFLASAEASPDAYHDGEVRGAVVGVIEAGCAPRWARLVDAGGAPLVEKAEGLVVEGARAWVLVDPDDPDAPGRLYEVALSW